jgi:hypothetical protein
VAAGLVQDWPAGATGLLYYWTTGCPADPPNSLDSVFGWSNYGFVKADGTFSMPIANLDQSANGFVVEVSGIVKTATGASVPVHRWSDCTSTLGSTTATTADTAAGATEVPVSSSTVPIGHVAVIDAGTTYAEQRLVTGHGSLIVAALSNPHSAGARVVDAGPPVPAYQPPPPPSNPTAPTFTGVPHYTAPGKPKVTSTKALAKGAAKVAFTAGPDGGTPIVSYLVRCTGKAGGKARTGSGKASPITVKKLTAGKKYACQVLATNLVGPGAYSAPGSSFIAKH